MSSGPPCPGSSSEPHPALGPHFCALLHRAEQEATLQKLREEWQSQQLLEKESLQRQQQLALREMKLAAEEAQQKEMSELEQEQEEFLSQLRDRLDRQKKKVRSLLPGQGQPGPLLAGRAVPSVGLTLTCRVW